MSMTFGFRQRTIKPRCDECNAPGHTHPYPKSDATEHQLNGTVVGGYRWLCPDCAYTAEHEGEVLHVELPSRKTTGPPQRERLFDL